MRFTQAPAKNERNVAERGIPFAWDEQFDSSTALIAEDTRKVYPEQRFQAMGSIGDDLHMPVFTPQDGAVHAISLRRASKRERWLCETQP